jgi:hypothetical protein
MSTAKFNTWLNPNGTENYKCRAWVNFNGTGTVAIRASGNVSSITDNGTGNYTVNFTTAMPDANYAAIGSTSSNPSGSTDQGVYVTSRTTTTCTVLTVGSAFRDNDYVGVSIFR